MNKSLRKVINRRPTYRRLVGIRNVLIDGKLAHFGRLRFRSIAPCMQLSVEHQQQGMWYGLPISLSVPRPSPEHNVLRRLARRPGQREVVRADPLVLDIEVSCTVERCDYRLDLSAQFAEIPRPQKRRFRKTASNLGSSSVTSAYCTTIFGCCISP